MSTRRTIEKINELIYSGRDQIYFILRITDNIALIIALLALIYSIGFDLEADEITRIFRWLEGLIIIFILDYFIRMLYSFKRVQYIFDRKFESILVFFSLFFILGYIIQIDIPYNLFLLLGFRDFRTFYEFFIALYLVVLTVLGLARASRLISNVKVKPATTFIASFILLIFIGTFLLMMPAMTTQVGSMPFLAALFTSTSASCVTGLSVVTVASYFTVKGQLVILILLQLGGIGIVSFATFFATFLSQGVGIQQQAIIQDVLSSESLSSAKKMLRQVILLTFSIEAIGAVALFFSWGPEVKFYTPVAQSEEAMLVEMMQAQTDSLETQNAEGEILPAPEFGDDLGLPTFSGEEEAAPSDEVIVPDGVKVNQSFGNKVYYSVFHSVSAFCNAGFSLFPNGLAETGVENSYVLHLVLVFIIIFGSLGFSTIQDVFSPRKLRERMEMPWKQWPLASKIAVNMTLILTFLGALGYFFFEQGHTLSGKNVFEAIVTSLFQSVTTRTAGFNTVDMGIPDLSQPTYIMFIFLMFIGAAPGSTGGGIKTSTFLLLVVSALSSIQGKKTVELGRRSIPTDTINRAFSIVAFAIAYNVFCILLLSIIEPDVDLRALFFELISAFATVGLSNGITGDLNPGSQVVLIVTMYIGRVGTLTLALALSKKVISTSYRYPSAHVMVG